MNHYVVYVVGFYFSEDLQQVVLIRKNRPTWQKGLLNGIGGKIQPNEKPSQAMWREFKEETGVSSDHWSLLFSLVNLPHNGLVHIFRSIGPIKDIRTMTDEKVELVRPEDIGIYNVEVVPNLRWIIPFCLESHSFPFTIIDYRED